VHRAFHEALIDGCASAWTLQLCRLLYDKSERSRNLAKQKTRDRGRDVDAEHRTEPTEILLAGGHVGDD
jgi:DNA-binding GntR family transcriptional regulator